MMVVAVFRLEEGLYSEDLRLFECFLPYIFWTAYEKRDAAAPKYPSILPSLISSKAE